MDEQLGLLLSGKIDVAKTVKQINDDIKTLSNSLNSLDLNVDLGKASKDIQEFNKNIEKSLGSAGKGIGGVGQQVTDSVSIDLDKLRKNHSDVFAEIDKLQKHYGGTIQSIKRQGGLDLTDPSDPERLNKVNVALKDLNGTLRNFEIRQMDGGLEIVGFNEISNIEKARKESEKLAESMGKGREQSLERQRKEQEKLAQTQARYSNKAIDDAHKEALAEKKKTDELQHQLQLAQRQAQINVQNLRRRYDPVLTPDDNKALDDYVRNMNNLSATTPNVKRHIQNLNTDFKSISSNVADAGSKVEGFGKQLQIAMARIPIWAVGMSMFYAPIQGIQNAIDQIITLDGQMVELKRVMDATPHTYNNLLKESIELSNVLGSKVVETQQAMNEWARQGFHDSTLSDLAETAVVSTNISDIQDTTEAVGVLTAAMKAYSIETNDSMSIIDKLNEVNVISLLA